MPPLTQPPPLPARPADGHKGMFGRVLVVGGHEEMIGAPVLAGTSALKMGAGLVQIAVPASVLATCLSITPELIGLGLGKGVSKNRLLEAAEKADALVIGPGLGQSAQAADRLDLLIRLEKSMVIDADALNLLASLKKWPKYFRGGAVLTPHPGEMARLAPLFGASSVPPDEEGRIKIATDAAKAFNQVIVLKGHRTVATDGSRVYLNETGDSSLSKAGAGDVLSGIVGALLAVKMDRFDAACASVWLHGTAGQTAGQRLGLRSVLSRDVIDSLPSAISALESNMPR